MGQKVYGKGNTYVMKIKQCVYVNINIKVNLSVVYKNDIR